MKLLIPILFVLVGLGGGVGVGMMLKPDPIADCKAMQAGELTLEAEAAAECEDILAAVDKEIEALKREMEGPTTFAELKRQFVVPLLQGERVQALVVASIALEMSDGTQDVVYEREPKLRDAFLEVLFVHAHSGGFDGEFTAPAAIEDLKRRLNEAALPIVGDGLRDVLLTEIVRQDY
ncbi:flagellar basal body-associated FliL family protein [Algicella marina]|uniref:Flagellar protein FliL n=1 Tax=Algicella marina TaxID=2683284 RepID=A0A6P1T426_9RHOB|nr:flagellar basal body-associated FliL family protein [Algicella marina]QHQ36453.1 flagellar basal body-associated protein FliL [Algicella marina]